MESKVELTDRWRREKREEEASRFRDDVRKACRAKGMSRKQADEHAWTETAKAFPPVQVADPSLNEPAESANARIVGLPNIPDSWPEMPGNASLHSELSWVQNNRLRIVEKTGGTTRVHLERSREPAPSWAALSWLETSIRVYAKFIEICAKHLREDEGEPEMIRRERKSIAEVRQLLTEMVDSTE
ncbi:MAG: hypothetical protein AAF670_11205 [Planctomycetota bacterium]